MSANVAAALKSEMFTAFGSCMLHNRLKGLPPPREGLKDADGRRTMWGFWPTTLVRTRSLEQSAMGPLSADMQVQGHSGTGA